MPVMRYRPAMEITAYAVGVRPNAFRPVRQVAGRRVNMPLVFWRLRAAWYRSGVSTIQMMKLLTATASHVARTRVSNGPWRVTGDKADVCCGGEDTAVMHSAPRA